jgi:hypothetical protein
MGKIMNIKINAYQYFKLTTGKMNTICLHGMKLS